MKKHFVKQNCGCVEFDQCEKKNVVVKSCDRNDETGQMLSVNQNGVNPVNWYGQFVKKNFAKTSVDCFELSQI